MHAALANYQIAKLSNYQIVLMVMPVTMMMSSGAGVPQ
jgi:hypothetical protein